MPRIRRCLGVSARTPNPRNRNIVSIYLERKVLERVAVPDRPARVRLCHFDDARVLSVGVVLDGALAYAGDVEQTVKQVGCPVEVCGAVGDVVPEHAHALERAAELV